tara:strand:+ start:617 stop:940 length:324 start_codon:yes stop_codon:yes gene_type:complete
MPELVPAPTGGGAAKERPVIIQIRDQRERISTIQNEIYMADLRQDYEETSRLRDKLLKAQEALHNLEAEVVGTDEEIQQRIDESTPEERFDLLSNLTRFRAGLQNSL